MAYQKVAIPRFYINALDFGTSIKPATSMTTSLIHPLAWYLPYYVGLLNTIPSEIYDSTAGSQHIEETTWNFKQPLARFPQTYTGLPSEYSTGWPNYYTKHFVAFLAHNMEDSSTTPSNDPASMWFANFIHEDAGWTGFWDYQSAVAKPIVNAEIYYPDWAGEGQDGFETGIGPGDGELVVESESATIKFPYKGFSIIGWDYPPNWWWSNFEELKVGSVISGTYYDMDNTCDLSVSMSRDYGEIKETTTYNGQSISNMRQDKPAPWGPAGAWELYSSDPDPEQSLAKSGRRSWDLKFSYMDSTNLWGSNQSLSSYLNSPTGINPSDYAGTSGNLSWTESIINQSGINGYEGSGGFTSTNTGWGAEHRNGFSYCGTEQVLNIAENIKYIIEFDLTITYGVGPLVDLKTIFNGESLTNEGETRATGGHFFMEFTTHTGESAAAIGFRHLGSDADSLVEVTNLTIRISTTNYFLENILTDNNFFSQVWHKTVGGTLPFLFQIDKDNNNPDQFAICKFKDSSLKVVQSTHKVYDVSFSIEEVW